MIRRRRFEKLPLQAQFYPMAGAAFLEDMSESVRFSLLGRQALGVASLEPGTMEVMLDRRLLNDDSRGLGEGLLDNHETSSSFNLIVESILAKTTKKDDETIGYHSLPANHASLRLHYPPIILFAQLDHSASAEVLKNFMALEQQLPCDMHLVALRQRSSATVYGLDGLRDNFADKSASMIIHRFGADCQLETPLALNCENSHGKININQILPSNHIRSIIPTSLTSLYEREKKLNETIELNPMQIYTVKINF